MEIDVREFLEQFPAGELARRGVLRGGTRQLKGVSVSPLINLMVEHDVSRLEAPERGWFLTSDREFQNRHSTEFKSGRVEDLDSPGSVFNLQNTSINPHYLGSRDPELVPEEESSDERKFGLERDLQQALRTNIGQLEPGLKIIDDGVERTVEAGRIDITAEDTDGCLVVIELKAGKANLRAIGQLLSYMGSAGNDARRPVRGILVAIDFDHSLVMAAKAVPNISLRAYSFQFSFSER